MSTALKIIFGIIIGVGVVACWPIIVAIFYIVGTAVVALIVGGGQILLAIGTCILVLWLAFKFAQAVSRFVWPKNGDA